MQGLLLGSLIFPALLELEMQQRYLKMGKALLLMQRKELFTMESELNSFPKKLINDVEGFIFYYPKKFPKIKEKYLELIEKYYNDPENFRFLCLKQSERLMVLAKRFAEQYKEISDDTDLKNLIEIDQKMHKLSCFNFWLYNYLICEGPLQEFHINKIKEMAEKVADGRDIEEVEKNVERIETVLIKTDY